MNFGSAPLETWMALAGTLTHDVAVRNSLDIDLECDTFRFDLSDPWQRPVLGEADPRRASSEAMQGGNTHSIPSPTIPARVLLVGAGGLGCPLGLLLATRLASGSKVVIADHDTVDPTNRNRQFLFSPDDAARSESKAIALCRALRGINPDIEWVPLVAELPCAEAAAHGPYDTTFIMTDTMRSRALVSRMGLAPVVVNAGVSFTQASAEIFHSETLELSEALGEGFEHEVPQSCAQAEPSIVCTTMFGASLAMALYLRHLAEGPQPARKFEYDLLAPDRGGLWPPF